MIRLNDETAIRAISAAVSVPFIRSHHQCVARFDDNGALIGGIFYTDYNGASIQMHVAGFRPRWLDRALLWIAFDYPFRHLGLKKVISPIPETNKKSLAFCLNLGFTVEATIPDVFVDGGLHIASLYRAQCRFLDMPRPAALTLEGNRGKAEPEPR